MTKIYLVRHAEAEGNLYRRIHGQYDSALTASGWKQLEALRERFADIALDVAYSSDLGRARQTAEFLCQPRGLAVQTRSDLREVSMGCWEDRPWGDVEIEDEEGMRLFRECSPDWKVLGGESLGQVQTRMHSALLSIAAKHPDQTVLVASHGAAIRLSCGAILGLSVSACKDLPHSDNTAVTLLEIEDGAAKIVFSDDNSHLPEELSTLARQKWWKNTSKTVALDENLRFEVMDLSQNLYKGLYLAARQEGWSELGRDKGLFWRVNYLEQAERVSRENPRQLLAVLRRNTIVGILQMDESAYAEDGAGYIAFFYLLPEYRGARLGVQMIGEAISYFRPHGFERLRLSCGADNSRALAFYHAHGFHEIDKADTPFGGIYLLEKDIALAGSASTAR